MGGMERDVHVNIPYGMLHESFLNTFISNNLNPEIGFDSEALDRFSPDAMVAVAGRIREAGLVTSIHSPFMDLSPGSTDSEIRAITRKRLNQVVRLIPLFRPKTVVCHTGYDHRRYWHMKEAWVERSLETWIWFAEAMHNEGALLMLENVYEQGPEDILPFFKQLPQDQVGLCLDTGHQNVFSETAMDIWVKSLGPYLKQLHLHDNCGEQDEHLALGKGRIDFVSLFDQLTSEDIRPVVVTLEPHREDELRPSLEYLKKIWPW